MKLSRQLLKDIEIMTELYLDCDENQKHHPELYREYQAVNLIVTNVPQRFEVTIARKELIPDTTDIILNGAIRTLLHMLETDYDSAETHEQANAIWEYLYKVYSFNHEDHNLLKHTTEEALSFAIHHINIEA